MKNAYCLYRVSTKKQVDKAKDDIPMQKIACHEFAEEKDWIIKKEFYEKGVSGFKVSANDRDAIQDLKEAALKHEFDTLLVYEYNNVGRFEQETPMAINWFIQNNIDVVSVKHEKRNFDAEVLKLTEVIQK